MDQQQGWTLEAVQELRQMAKDGLPAETISLKLKRPLAAVQAKLAELGVKKDAAAAS